MKDDTIYKMWYSYWNVAGYIGYAISFDGITWYKHNNNPILTPGDAGEWDDEGVAEPYVIKESGIYKMWYWSISGGIQQVGYATSLDGIVWEKYSENPVINSGSTGSWDEIEAGFPSVIHKDGGYKMWYTGQDIDGNYTIGYATSPDGIDWTKYGSNPVLTPSIGGWDETGVYGGRVLFDGLFLEYSIRGQKTMKLATQLH